MIILLISVLPVPRLRSRGSHVACTGHAFLQRSMHYPRADCLLGGPWTRKPSLEEIYPHLQRLASSGKLASMGQMAVVPLLAVGAVAACLALLAAPAVALQAAVTENHPRIYVASLPSILNTRTLTDYDVRRFFTQFGADPNGVWSNPVGELRQFHSGLLPSACLRTVPPAFSCLLDPGRAGG